MVPSILFSGEVVDVVELIEVGHFSRIFDLSHFRDPPDQVRRAVIAVFRLARVGVRRRDTRPLRERGASLLTC